MHMRTEEVSLYIKVMTSNSIVIKSFMTIFCSGERKKYYKHQKKAESNPDKYLSIIIDGMDQSKTHLPHWIQCSKVGGVLFLASQV